MSDGYAKILLLGNLGAAPELRYTQTGQAVLNMRLACSESYLDKDKVRRERVEWFTCVVWGPRAEGLSKILTKGSRIFVDGSPRSSTYEKDGVKHTKQEVNVNDVVLAGGHRAGADDSDAGDHDDNQGGTAPQTSGYRDTRSSGGSSSSRGGSPAGDFEVAFGRDKGRRISEVDDLSWLRGVLEKDLADSSKERFHDKARGQLAAIDAEMARRTGGGARAIAGGGGGGGYAPRGAARPAPQEAPPPADDYDAGGGFGDDSDIPF